MILMVVFFFFVFSVIVSLLPIEFPRLPTSSWPRMPAWMVLAFFLAGMDAVTKKVDFCFKEAGGGVVKAEEDMVLQKVRRFVREKMTSS